MMDGVLENEELSEESSKSKPNSSTPSTQEEDLLQRSNKKVKIRDDGVEEEEVVKDDMMEELFETPSPNSYKEVLMDAFGSDSEDDNCWGDCLDEDMPENKYYKVDDMETEGVTKTFNPSPKVPFTDEELKQWSKPWKNTLIVKVMGKKVNFWLLENKLRKEWQRNDMIKITNLADDFYLVRLSSIDDYRHALFEGPWKIADHYPIVQRWRPLFSLTASLSKKVVVWVRVPTLPLELCNDQYQRRIGSFIGTMLKVDRLTSIHDRGKFARIL